MITLVIASRNPVKMEAARMGFQKMFPGESFSVESVSVPSGVSRQPMTSEETRQGALNRARGAMQARPEGDFWVGIEGGVEPENGNLAAFAWIVILSREHTGESRTGTFFLPRVVADLVRQGKELGEADDLVFQRSNSKQENGAIGILTDNVIDRQALYAHAVILALLPFKNPDLYPAV